MKKALLICCALLLAQWEMRGVILLDDAAEAANTSEPSGALAGSGWQFEGDWGGFLGTPIAPHFFISAAHIGRAASVFSYHGATYTIVTSRSVVGTDLLIWQVVETFPDFAPLYTRANEVGNSLVVIGRGTERGDEVGVNGELRGWRWGAGLGTRRWGQNVVTSIATNQSIFDELLYATFDKPGVPNESHLSGGDSGGAVFMNDNGVWKLAGINFSVDGDFATVPNPDPNSDDPTQRPFNAALWDANGLWFNAGDHYEFLNEAQPVPTGFYASRISAHVDAIYSIIDPNGDPDGDGIPNLLEYALRLDPLTPDANMQPAMARQNGVVTFTYRKNLAATDLNYLVEESTDLVQWQQAQSQDDVISDDGHVQTIRATITDAPAGKLFLRLLVVRP